MKSLPDIREKLEARLKAGVAGVPPFDPPGNGIMLSVEELVIIEVVEVEPADLNRGMWEMADQSGGSELLGRLPLPGIETERA